jgi:hypothetical protein
MYLTKFGNFQAASSGVRSGAVATVAAMEAVMVASGVCDSWNFFFVCFFFYRQ